MSIECAECGSQACRAGRADVAPEACPMHGDFPAFEELYADADQRRMAYEAALVEALGYCHWTRLHEIAELARRMELRRVGIGHCPDMAREAALAAAYLRDHKLDVRLPPERLDCDPLQQARRFAREKTQLNIVAGMCAGHEAIFIRASRAPVTILVVRDTRFRHNPAAALYTSDTYARSSLYTQGRPSAAVPYRGREMGALHQAAEDLLPRQAEPWSRVQEAMELAHRLGATHIGLSFCVGFRREARILTRVLEANGFRVSSVACKTGAVPKENLGIQERQKVHPGRAEMMCNSLAQAELLNRSGVQLAFILGQCVGHDSATMGHLEAPAICIVAKDRVLAHNTVAALYELI